MLGELPAHIIRKIAGRESLSPKKSLCEPDNCDNSITFAEKCSAISAQWRACCLPLLCVNVMFNTICHTFSIVQANKVMNTLEFVANHNAHIYTKSVVVYANYADIISGTALHRVNSPILCKKIFASVISIKLILSIETPLPYGIVCSANIMRFAIGLNQLFPKASICRLEGDGHSTHARLARVAGFDLLVASLLANKKDIAYRALEGYVLDWLPAMTKLTRISHRETNDSDLFIQLICLNSSTLVELDIEYKSESFLQDIVLTDDGVFIHYPGLKRLCLIYQGQRVDGPVLDLDGAPFPSLTKLKLHKVANIASDTLFKSNHLTLEYLDIGVIANGYRTVSNAANNVQMKFPKLKYVKSVVSFIGEPSQLEAEHSLLEFVIESGPTVQRLELDLAHCFNKSNLVSKICSSSAASHLVFLEILHLDLSVMDIMTILKRVPNLTHLALQPPEEESAEAQATLEHVVDEECLTHFCKSYMMADSKLAVIDLDSSSDSRMSTHFGLMIGIVCPHMSIIRWRGHMPLFESTYRLISSLPVYRRHKGRLQEIEFVVYDSSDA